MAVRAKLIFGLFCIGGAVALLAVRAPAQQTGSITPAVRASDPAMLDAQLRPYGFAMLDAPLRQGPYYLVRARDPRGIETRMVVEADSGQIVSATPVTTAVRPLDYSPYYDASPRIISIPQADDLPVPQRQAHVNREHVNREHVTREYDRVPRASAPQRPQRTAARAPVQEPMAEPVPPRRVVRQVVPPREQPYRQPYRPAAVPLPPADPAPRAAPPPVTADPVPLPRSQTLPRVTPPVVPSDVATSPQAAPVPPTPRTRPRTVLAPPPYAEGPTPLKPLYHRDGKRFAPAQSDMPPAPPETSVSDTLPGSDRHASVQPGLPSIPGAPPAAPVSEPAGVPMPQAADAHANANEMPPEEVPPGTVTLDTPSR